MAKQWRRWFRAFHRDIGYVVVALTLAYSISGIAVNHIEDWNPNYTFETRSVDIGPLPTGSLAEQEAAIVERLQLPRAQVRGHVRDSEFQMRVFLPDGQDVAVDVRTGRGEHKLIGTRTGLFQLNALHLNNLKGLWTYIADLFALCLIILAITGVSMMKGDRGFMGRGKYFVGAGLAVPVIAVIYMYW